MNTEVIRWGIVGTGTMANKFAAALVALPSAKITAVGSRSPATAEEFGGKFNVPHRHASYDRLFNDAEVDAIYVATPHTFHCENALAALAAGKHVLVEKPFTINAAEAEKVIALGRARRLLVMEAMWTRYLPLYVRLRELLAEGAIGEPRMLTAEFGFKAGPQTNRRLIDPALGGGALLDIGVYPVSLASMIFGPPSETTGLAMLGRTGVDEQNGIVLRYARGQLAIIANSIQTATSMEVVLTGTDGSMRIHAPAWKSTAMTLKRDGSGEQFLEFPFPSNGFQFEAIEFMNCLREGKLESPIMPLDETLQIMKTLDGLRAQWGFRYPMESHG